MEIQELTLSHQERERIIRDISHWKTELEYASGLSDEELREFVEDLRREDDPGLIGRWKETVGEWLAHRGDLRIPRTVSFDTWVEYQFGLLLQGQETDYGYVVSVSIPSRELCLEEL